MMLGKVTRFVLWLLYCALAASGLLACSWLLVHAVTWVGRGIAIFGLMLTCVPLTIYWGWKPVSAGPFWRWASGGMLGIMLLIACGILLAAPPGDARPDAPVSHRFTSSIDFPRYTLANIVPEAEQINLGFWLMPYLDPILTQAQARRVAAFTLELYREMESDPDFRRLGSAMGWAYADLMGQRYDVGHYYLYIPRSYTGEPLPAIVFLHGSVGNFKTYTWIWSQLAQELGYVIIAPSFGFGEWQRPGGTSAVLEALDDAQKVVQLDPDRIYLVGLSNGGLGVSYVAESASERFRGLVFISPVMATEIVDAPSFQQKWANRPVLVISGESDRRVPVAYVERHVQRLQRGNVPVTYLPYTDQDHFLFFAQRERVISDISRWLLRIDE